MKQKIAEAREIAARAGLPLRSNRTDERESVCDRHLWTITEKTRTGIWSGGLVDMLATMPSYGGCVYRADGGTG